MDVLLVRLTRMLGVVVVAAAASACAFNAPTAPTPSSTTPSTTGSTAPATIRLTASTRPDQQIDVIATVLTADGGFVSNVGVTFTVGAGTITPSTGVTDANGAVRAIASTPTATTLTAATQTLTTSMTLSASAPTVSVPSPAPNPTPTPTPTPSQIILNVPATGTTGATISMFVSAAATAGPFTWSFGDGSATVQTTAFNTTHAFTSPGTYTVGVTGSSASASSTIVISNASSSTTPTTSPSLSLSLTCGTSPTHATATPCNITVTDETGAIVTSSIGNNVTWDWGDGSTVETGKGVQNTHTYAQAGTFTVQVSATGSGGRTGKTSKVLTVS